MVATNEGWTHIAADEARALIAKHGLHALAHSPTDTVQYFTSSAVAAGRAGFSMDNVVMYAEGPGYDFMVSNSWEGWQEQ